MNDKTRLFWSLQTLGWLAYGLLNLLTGTYRYLDRAEYIRPTMAYVLAGFILTLIMRYIFKAIRNKSPVLVIPTALIVTGVAAAIFSVIQVVAFVNLYPTERELHDTWEYFAETPFAGYVLMSWTGLYFGITYYLALQEQTAKALKSASLAHQAQLKMLRYQLNPHFLFNTLNAISTLVLDNDPKNADRMLTRLSSFLRYSLVNEPTQKVSLDQEIQALNLYLEIEKARFQERLKLEFDIEERARDALIPSLIMQPIIENAIKYAIAPSEDGGTIKVSARLAGPRLELAIEDDGPGLSVDSTGAPTHSSGVGLANTKERLRQLYHAEQIIKVQNIEPHGLRVTLCLPCEFSPVDP